MGIVHGIAALAVHGAGQPGSGGGAVAFRVKTAGSPTGRGQPAGRRCVLHERGAFRADAAVGVLGRTQALVSAAGAGGAGWFGVC